MRSRPQYAPFKLDPSGRAHLVVTSLDTPPEGIDNSLANIETWVVKHLGAGVPAPATPCARPFRSSTELLTQLSHRLQRETAGLRLYAIGSEAFVWDVHNAATALGMHPSEIFLHRAGALHRRVYCTHCRTIIEDVPVNIVTCPCCEANLFVRDHFSKRLAAFMGIKVDAEVPGEVPQAEVFMS